VRHVGAQREQQPFAALEKYPSSSLQQRLLDRAGAVSALLAWILVVVGLTVIVTRSSLFAPLRRLLPWKLLHCPMCFGFWAGFGVSALCGVSAATLLNPIGGSASFWVACFLDGCAASTVNWVVHVVLVRLGSELL
jgi:hypothetical protein